MSEHKSYIRPWAMLLVAAELALAAFVMVRFEFDLAKPLGWDLMWVVPVFVGHSLMPLPWRRPFLLAITVALLMRVLGVTAGIYVVAIGLLLIGLCHLPIAFRWRVMAVLGIAVVLALVQVRILYLGHYVPMAMPILGGIFMFRLILYLYEIRHEKPGDATPLERIGYFFLLPAPLAPFFPALDYEIYLRSYYQRPAFETYQTGILWISRGVVHLALYRVIYHFFSPSAETITDLAGVAAFCLSGYLIYLRVSGLFHIISGALRLFGYALPETHRLYFFAHNFSDYWRRINIYWKEFMTKIVFFPVFMGMRKSRLSQQWRLSVATVVVFVATAVLHSYQTFWLRGDFAVHETDYAFWGVLGLFVVANNLIEARRGPVRRNENAWHWKKAAMISLRAVGMFTLFALLWALWSAQEWRVYFDVMKQAANAPGWQVLMLSGIALAAVILGTAGQWAAHCGFNLFEEHPGLKRSVATTVLPMAALALVWQFHLVAGLPGWWGRKLEVIWVDQPNTRDQINKERSYYEGLLAVGSSVGAEEEAKVKEVVSDIRGVLYQANFGPEKVWGDQWSTNRWGMRDQFYSKKKPPGVFRIAVSGASYVSGRGVGDGETFESLVEERLKDEGNHVEILNFGSSGSCTVQRLADLELRILNFQPDAFFLICHGGELDRNVRALARLASAGESELTYPYLEELFERADVSIGDSESEIIRALTPFCEELMQWTYGRIAEVCREHGVTPVWIYLANTRTRNLDLAEDGRRFAEEAGLLTIVLDDAYGGLPWQEVVMNEIDTHPNELGHELIAKSLYEKIIENREAIGLPAADVDEK